MSETMTTATTTTTPGMNIQQAAAALLGHETSGSIRLENVCKSYGPKKVLGGVSLTAEPGEFISVVGPSGCGKSTLLRLVLGQELQDSGNVLLDEEPAGFADARRGIVYQKYSLWPHLTVLGNAMAPARLRQWRMSRVERRNAEQEAMSMLEAVGLADDATRWPHELSGGMQQRVAVAQALLGRPKVLLMDEPFSALDSSSRASLGKLVKDAWKASQVTILFVTHDLPEAMSLGTRLLVLSQWRSDHIDPNGARIVLDQPLKGCDQAALAEAVLNLGYGGAHAHKR